MNTIFTTALWIIGGMVFTSFGVFALVSLREGERRAARVAFGAAVSGGLPVLLGTCLPVTWQAVMVGGVALAGVILLVLFFLPVGRISEFPQVPENRVDERDMMFARARLKPGSANYAGYYNLRPENKAIDDQIRARPGLLSPESKYANPFLFAAPDASFFLTEALRDAVDGPVAAARQTLPVERMTRYLKHLAKYFGALDVGVAELKPYHIYTHIGRGTGQYGAPVTLDHRYAIVFTVEMDHAMIGANPTAPGIVESAREYVESARIAVQLAAAIRNLGYPARAHIDGNYRVIAPLAARDAGLGEIGRMGLLITPKYGPRVRLGVVTTSLELAADAYRPDHAIIDFCNICKKCALNCPSRSIPFDSRREIGGALRWQINAETCFHYWNVVGTDCGLCMTVCPYSHPNTLFHNVIRWGIDRSGFFRRFASFMDDVFYGKKPAPRQAPKWTQIP